MKNTNIETKAIRNGYTCSHENEHSEAIFLTSSFIFKSAEDARAHFAKEVKGNIYSRFTNPTVTTFQKKLALIENAQACVATASGMAAIFATIMALLKSGDHIVVSQDMFGTTIVLLNDIVAKYKIEVSFVELEDINSWKKAIKENTKLFLLETPSNPLGKIVDIKKLANICKNNNILLAIDNVILTPVLQNPLELGADIVIHSATKYIDGQGRCLGGAVLANDVIIDKVESFVRSTGPSLSAFNAWLLLKGIETLSLRVKAHCDNAKKLANWLTKQTQIEKVYYLGLESHPDHNLAKKQQKGFGAIVSFEVKGGREKAFKVIDNTTFFSITANLGDTKSTITHPATTTHSRLSDAAKIKAGISDGLIRISVGLENINDVIEDLHKALLV